MGKLKTFFVAIVDSFDARDFLYFGGVSMLGYGLYQWNDIVAFIVCGIILMATGYLMKDGR